MPQLFTGALAANVTLSQPGSGYFRLNDALAFITNSNANILALQEAITTLESQVATLQSQVTAMQQQVATLSGAQNYTGLEVNTGSAYINGSLIYRRSFNFQIGNITNAAFIYAHGIPAFALLVSGQGTMVVSAQIGLPLTYINMIPSPPVDGCAFYVDPTNIYVLNGNANRSAYTFVINLWYTATDR